VKLLLLTLLKSLNRNTLSAVSLTMVVWSK